MVDNFELIKGLLQFSSPLDFYYVTILLRKADVPDATRSVKVVDQYCIYSLEDLEEKKELIIKDCEDNNARAYIYVNRRNSEMVALETIRLSTEYVIAKDYKAVRNAFWKAVGRRHAEEHKKWIVDVDSKDNRYLLKIGKVLEDIEPVGEKAIEVVPTRSGYHVITKPFNVMEFRKTFPEIDIHKDNPTLLYFNS